MSARHHHYLSQCYLKGFTKNGSKKSMLSVIDFKKKTQFETKPRNVGGIRDFNRINIDGVDQNTVETSLSEFEGRVATAIKRVDETPIFNGTDKDHILNLIALLSIRSPEMRENFRQFQVQVLEMIMDLSLETKERWESQMEKMKADGQKLEPSISYEEIKAFHDRKKYRIELSTEHHLRMEMVGIDAILPCLYRRNWLLIQSTGESGFFITSDHPVILTWNEPNKIPSIYRNSPGFGLKDTQVYFPLTKNIALLGEFDGREGVINAKREVVALLNSKIITFAYKQVYAPKIDFYFMGSGGELLDGNRILREINA